MKVLLISANREEINMRTWPLGPACVAAAAQGAGHDVEFLDLMRAAEPESSIAEAIRRFRPDVIGVSVRNVDDQKMENPKFLLEDVKQVVSRCKQLSAAPVVLGGAGYSMYPESLLKFLNADMGIQGEGESAFLLLLGRLREKADLTGVPGLYLQGRGMQGDRSFQRNLDAFPLPDPALLGKYVPKHEDFWLPVQTRRGCPFRCSYCSTATIEGCVLRKRSPEEVVGWINEWVRRDVRQFYFVDNTFNLPASYAQQLCSGLMALREDLSWRCIIYPIHVDADLAAVMAEAGCKEVALGFESGSELILHGLNKRFKPEDVRRISDVLAKNRIRRMGFLLLGGPGETRQTALESLRFADSLGLEAMKLNVGIRIYPYTALARKAVDEGVILPEDDLLSPRFYLAKGLETWLRETVMEWMSTRPNWMT